MAETGLIELKSSSYFELIDITSEVKNYVRNSDITSGIVIVFTPHTTAAVTINENADPSVRSDIIKFLKKNYPGESYFTHSEGNSPSHILSSLFSPSLSVIVEDGELILGIWQAIYFCEFDGPRRRKVYFKVMEDS